MTHDAPARGGAMKIGLAIAALAAVVVAAVLLLQRRDAAPVPPPSPAVAVAPATAAASEPASAAIAAAPVPEPVPDESPLAAPGLQEALAATLGADATRRFLQLDDFPRRVVATVDNLARPHAASALWPVVPTSGRFAVVERGGRTVIDPDNQLRYVALVQLLERVDAAALVTLYVRMLPLLQPAYEELGYSGQRFHARLVAVIDHLLAAPEPPETIEVMLTDVRGPVPSQRPWVRYEFADPALQSASAGHKLMVRIGATNQRRVKARLREIRRELAERGRSR